MELSDSLDSCWEPNDSDLWLHVNHRTSVCQIIRVWHRPSDVRVPSYFGVTFGSSTHSQQERKILSWNKDSNLWPCKHVYMQVYTYTCISNNCHRFCNDLTCLTANWSKPMSFRKVYLKKNKTKQNIAYFLHIFCFNTYEGLFYFELFLLLPFNGRKSCYHHPSFHFRNWERSIKS